MFYHFHPHRLYAALGLVLLTIVTLLSLVILQVRATGITCDPSASVQQASVSSDGVQGDVSGNLNSLSSDGRYVYFPSRSANLVAGDTNGAVDYFEFDRTNCQTRRITVGPNGEQGDGDSDSGSVSGNGQFFVFGSKASTFATGDTNGKYDIFVKNLQTGAVTRIAADPTNSISTTYYIGGVSISDDGRYVVFDVLVSDFSAPSGFAGTPILYDLQTSTRTQLAAEGHTLSISGDGQYIAFVSSRSDLVVGDTNNADDVFVYERATGIISRVSVATDGTQGGSIDTYPSIAISDDGRFVVFAGYSKLAPNDLITTQSDVYIRDRLTNQTTLVSVNTDGTQIVGGGAIPVLSADGRYVFFISTSNSLKVRDRQTSQTYTITSPETSNGGLQISGDGQYLAFSTSSGTDPNIRRNVYIARRAAFAPATPTPTPTPTTIPACDLNASMVNASVSSNGTQGNNTSSQPHFSSTGRYIVYQSSATNLVTGDTNGKLDVFVLDRITCQTTRASVAANGTQGNNSSAFAGISFDGRYVAFSSLATNLTSGDSDNLWDVYIKDLQTGTVTRLAAGLTGATGTGFFVGDTYSVVYTTSNTISLYDIQTQQQTVLVTSANLGLFPNAISADGRYLVFNSSASTIVANDTNNVSDVFLLDRQTSQITRVSVSSAGDQSNDGSDNAIISADGRYVVFNSHATNLVPNDTVQNNIEVFVRDLQTSTTTRISVSNSGSEENGSSGYGSISDDGRYIAFLSQSTNLVDGDNNDQIDIFVRDQQTNQTYVISRTTGGVFGNGQSDRLMISHDGNYIAFGSGASNLVAGDTNNNWDIFVAKRLAFAPVPPTPTPTATDTATDTPTSTLTPTPTDTATDTPTNTPTPTATDTATDTPTYTPSYTPTDTPTPTATDTATDTPTSTLTPTPTDTATDTPTSTLTPTPTDTATDTPTLTPSDTATDTPTSTLTPTPTDTPTSTFTPTLITPTSVPNAAPQINFSTSRTKTLTWNPVSWATGYQIQVSMDKNFAPAVTFTGVVQADTLDYTMNNLPNGTYYWRIEAISSTSNVSIWSNSDSFVISAPP